MLHPKRNGIEFSSETYSEYLFFLQIYIFRSDKWIIFVFIILSHDN